jgi:predicted esterase
MERSRARRFGVKGWVYALCLLGAAPRASAQAEPSAAPAPIVLPEGDDQPGVVIFPAREAGPHPITVLLHGMCGDPARSCSHFADEVTRTSTLICPRASQRCEGGGSSWPESGVSEAVERAVARAKAELPGVLDDTRGRTLIGYSLGAFRALQIAQSSAGKYPRVMLIGAKVSLNQNLLAQNGVERLLLCAGNADMTHDHMRREAQRIRGPGVSARFLDLGPVGHFFTPSFGSYLPSALSWLRGV